MQVRVGGVFVCRPPGWKMREARGTESGGEILVGENEKSDRLREKKNAMETLDSIDARNPTSKAISRPQKMGRKGQFVDWDESAQKAAVHNPTRAIVGGNWGASREVLGKKRRQTY